MQGRAANRYRTPEGGGVARCAGWGGGWRARSPPATWAPDICGPVNGKAALSWRGLLHFKCVTDTVFLSSEFPQGV